MHLPLAGGREVGVEVAALHACEEELTGREHVAVHAAEHDLDLAVGQEVPGGFRSVIVGGV